MAQVQLGLPDTFDFWNGVRWWSTIIAAVAAVVAALGYWRASDIERKEKTAGASLEADIKKSPHSQWPSSLLIKEGYKPVPVDAAEGINVLVDVAKTGRDKPTVASVIVKGAEDETLAWALTFALGEHYVWPYSHDDLDHLLDGEVPVALTDAVKATGIVERVRATGASAGDLIGIGLESSLGGIPDDTGRTLSTARAVELMEAAEQVLQEAGISIPIDYRALGLGRAKTQAPAKNSGLERLQRSALLVFVARKMNDTAKFNTARTVITIVEDVDELTRINLTDYEYAKHVGVRLSPPLVGEGEGDSTWKYPTASPEEAAARSAGMPKP